MRPPHGTPETHCEGPFSEMRAVRAVLVPVLVVLGSMR